MTDGEEGRHPRGGARHPVPARRRRASRRRCCRSSTSRRSSTWSRRRSRAGLTDILIITGRGKRAIEDHFDRNFELEYYLEQTGKHDLLRRCRTSTSSPTSTTSARRDPLGLGHAVSVAREHVGDEPFAVLLGDDIMVDDARAAPLDARRARPLRPRRCLALHRGRRPTRSRPTAASSPRRSDDGLVRVRSIVEKPKPEDAPSNLAVIGRYVFTPEIFDALDRIKPGAGGELQLTDAIELLLETQTVFGRVFTRRPLRHRPEARLPPGQHRARARPARPRPRARRRTCVDARARPARRDARRRDPMP